MGLSLGDPMYSEGVSATVERLSHLIFHLVVTLSLNGRAWDLPE